MRRIFFKKDFLKTKINHEAKKKKKSIDFMILYVMDNFDHDILVATFFRHL